MGALGTARNIPLGLPFEGMDLQTPLSQLPMSRAPYIENFFIDGQTIRVRGGSIVHCQISTSAGNLSGAIGYNNPNGNKALYVVDSAQGKLYDATTSTASTEITGATLGNYFLNFNKYLYLFGSGADSWAFDGVDWAEFGTNFATSGLTAGYTYSATVGNLCAGNGFKNRIYLVEDFSTFCWYGGVNSISGALTKFDIGSLINDGGTLSNVYPVSIGGGGQSQAYLAFVTSEGEVLYYAGSYPGSTNWELVARVKTGKPKSRKSFTFYQGDTLLATSIGLVSLRDLLVTYNTGQPYLPISFPIDPLWRAAENDTGITYGNMVFNEKTGCLYIVFEGFDRTNNVVSSSGAAVLLVYSIINKVWFYYSYSQSSISNTIVIFDDDIYLTYETAGSKEGLLRIEQFGRAQDQDPDSAGGAYAGFPIVANILSAALSTSRDSGLRQKFNSLELYAYINTGSTTGVSCYLVENFGKVTATTSPAHIDDDFNSVQLNVGSAREYVQYNLKIRTDTITGEPTVLYNLNALMEQGGYR